jgi:signal transduction histidine kinase
MSTSFRTHASRLSLRQQILAGFASLAMVLCFAAAKTVAVVETAFLTEAYEHYNERMLDVIRSSALEAMIAEDQPLLRSLAERLLGREPAIARVSAFNERQEPLVMLSKQGSEESVQEDALRVFRQKVSYMGEDFGSIEIVWDLSRQVRLIWQHSLFIAGIMAAVLLMLTGAIYLAVTVSVLRPIATFDRQIRRYAEGDLVTAVAQPSAMARELQRVGCSIRELGNSLKANQTRTAELEAAKKESERANRTKSEFLAGMSHELRTPLNAIIGFSEIMKREMLGPVGTPQYQGYAADILASATLLLDLVNDVLDLAKIEVGQFDLEEGPVDVVQLVHDSITIVKGAADAKRISIRLRLEGGYHLLCDRRRIRQVLINILSNAVKFTDTHGTVDVFAEVDADGRLTIAIRDNGRGVAEENLAMVMQPFGQVRSGPYETAEGTGLGLPISKNLVELHNGKLDISSTLGEGTEVRIVFPSDRVVPRPLVRIECAG